MKARVVAIAVGLVLGRVYVSELNRVHRRKGRGGETTDEKTP